MADKTKEVIAKMLRENTGAAFMDSGGAYGRNWERNQQRRFQAEPRGKLHFYSGYASYGEPGTRYGGFDASINLYHYLTDRLEFSETMDTLFYEIYLPLAPDDWHYDELTSNFPDFLALRGIWKDRKAEIETLMLSKPEWRELWGQDSWEWVDSVYESEADDAKIVTPAHDQQTWEVYLPLGQKAGEWSSEYTYNTDNHLDQDFIYTVFDWDNTQYCILVVHGGCDARGGFTRPRFFECGDWAIARTSDCFIHCQNGHYWDTSYDGYHFRFMDESNAYDDSHPNLDEDYEILDDETYNEKIQALLDEFMLENGPALNYKAQMEAGQAGFENMPMPDADNFDPQLTKIIRHDKDGNGYCPLCNTLLELDFFPE